MHLSLLAVQPCRLVPAVVDRSKVLTSPTRRTPFEVPDAHPSRYYERAITTELRPEGRNLAGLPNWHRALDVRISGGWRESRAEK